MIYKQVKIEQIFENMLAQSTQFAVMWGSVAFFLLMISRMSCRQRWFKRQRLSTSHHLPSILYSQAWRVERQKNLADLQKLHWPQCHLATETTTTDTDLFGQIFMAKEKDPKASEVSMEVHVGEDEFEDAIEVLNCLLSPADVALREKLSINENKGWLSNDSRDGRGEKKRMVHGMSPINLTRLRFQR